VGASLAERAGVGRSEEIIATSPQASVEHAPRIVKLKLSKRSLSIWKVTNEPIDIPRGPRAETVSAASEKVPRRAEHGANGLGTGFRESLCDGGRKV
jgi:hypothetical protein